MSDYPDNCPICKHDTDHCFCDTQEFWQRIEELEKIAYCSDKTLLDEVIAAKGLRVIAERKLSELEAKLTDENSESWKDLYRKQIAITDQLNGRISELEAKLERVRNTRNSCLLGTIDHGECLEEIGKALLGKEKQE
jgi:hypothetical protein